MSCARHPEQERASVQSDGLSVLLHRPSPYAGAHRGGEWAGGAVARPVHSQGVSSSGDGVWSNNHTKEKKSMSVHSRGGRPVVPVRRRNPLSSSDRISESARPPARSSALARTRKKSRNPSVNLDCSVRTWTTPSHRDLNSLYLLPRHHPRRAGEKEGFSALGFDGSIYSTVTSRGPVLQSPAVPVPLSDSGRGRWRYFFSLLTSCRSGFSCVTPYPLEPLNWAFIASSEHYARGWMSFLSLSGPRSASPPFRDQIRARMKRERWKFDRELQLVPPPLQSRRYGELG